ncbi:uncharacterized protein [Lolium perenne]|uniref:uncharacterized protein isoform X3 n=1 Tax=Lolium perenne TaxID=4522 RepID=UPI0021F52CEE|nr:uncharacterized protein LOC127307800 isoform X3 [Lolium perenne]
MIGAADENDAEDVRPSNRTTPPSPPPPPIAPPQPTSLGRRLLGSIRALASRPAPPPAAPAPKVGLGLGLLLHLTPDQPRIPPTPSLSQEDEDGAAAAARPHAAAGAALHLPLPVSNQCSADPDQRRAQAVGGIPRRQICGRGNKEKAPGEQQRAVHRQGAAFLTSAAAAAAGDDQQEMVCTADQLRADSDGGQDAIHPRDGTTCRSTAAVGDQEEKAVQQCGNRELGAAEDDGDDAQDNDQEPAAERGATDTSMDGDDAVKDHDFVLVGQSAIAGTEIKMHAATIHVQDQHRGVGATVPSSEAVSATVNGSDMGTGKKEKVRLPYPQRPGKLNCPSYMSKGTCSLGFSCQKHHPLLKAKPDDSWCPSEQGNHGVEDILELNRIGLPIRESKFTFQGARNCTYYVRNGACKYGKRCHFNHPEHVIDAQFYAPTGWEDSTLKLEKSYDHHTTLDDTSHSKKSSGHATLDYTSYSTKSSDHANLDDTSYSKKSSDHATIDDTSSSSEVLPPNILRMLLPPKKVLPGTEGKDPNWSSTSDNSDGCCSADSSDGPLCKQEHVDSSHGPLCKQEHVDYPERPGRSECSFYKMFGDCKFASACNYHHPKDRYPIRYHPEIPSVEQTKYLERPGEPDCPFYMKNRFCKFMEKCRFNHPKDSNPTARSPTTAKKSAVTDEHHQSTGVTLEDHMPKQKQYPERPGQPDCRYYLQFRKCKFLSACIFHHPRDGLPVGWNPSGPAHSDQIRPVIHGMPECPFYMKSGKCQFGSACEFRHPKDMCSTTEGAFDHITDLANDNFTRPENVVQKQEQTMYPERPGEPRCFNYMRHGSCRFQMNCKYHHPADQLTKKQYDSTYH